MKNFNEILDEVKSKSYDPEDDVVDNRDEQTQEQKVHDAIAHVDPNLVLRNLAFWFDIAIAKGRYIDLMQQQVLDNGVPTSDNDTESEI